jgi:ABC-type uncharacterized transport system substrate-binding protein
MRETEATARALGLQFHTIEARTSAELEAAFQAVANKRPSAFFTLGGGMFQDNMRHIVAFATQARLPGVYPKRPYAEARACRTAPISRRSSGGPSCLWTRS